MVIISQPEARLIRDLIAQNNPVFTLDLHGYVTPTLLWPSTPPHNPNNEYDLYITHGLANALDIEEGLRDLGYPETQSARIPFRDDPAGVWDDFPPIYVPAFAMFQSSIPYTIEAPLNPRGGNLTPEERRRRSGINTDVHEVAIKTTLKYIQDNRNKVLWDQAEVYRRGWAGEQPRTIPDNFVPGWGPEDNYTTTFPRAYVIPAGARQRSAPAVKRLVDLLLGSGGRVTQATAAFTAGGNSYPAGSLVIDMHQPKRGIVNSLLEPGLDITDRVDDLYAGPAGWSHALTWGATVDTLQTLPAVATERIFAGSATGSVAAGNSDLLVDPQDASDFLAINALHAAGVKLTRLSDGRVLVPGSARALAQTVATQHGTTFTAAPSSWSGVPVDKVVVAYTGGSEVRDTLGFVGFESRAATATTLTTVLTADVDVLRRRRDAEPEHAHRAQPRGAGRVPGPWRRRRRPRHGRLVVHHQRRPADRDRHVGVEPDLRRGQRGQPRWADRQRRAGDVVDLPARLVLEPRHQRDRRAVLRRRPAAVGLVAVDRECGPGDRGRQGQRRARGRQQPQRRLADRHQRGHPPARQGPVLAVRARDPLRGRAAAHDHERRRPGRAARCRRRCR